MKFSKEKMLSSSAVNGETTPPFLTLCHGHFRPGILQEDLQITTPTAQPPTPRAAEPSLCLSLPHKQHTHLLPLVRLWFSTFSSILPLQLALSSAPHISPVSAAQQGDTPLRFDDSLSCTQGSPTPALPSIVSHLQGHHFFKTAFYK